MGHKSHKHGHKKSHHHHNSFKHDFKHGFIGGASAIQSAGHEINKASPYFRPVGDFVRTVGGVEKLAAASADTIGSKNPSKRFQKNMAITL